ncbi:MAG: hypothetical protein PVF99_07225 [Desulfobacterales bacterium]|jgi:hypothetical protein
MLCSCLNKKRYVMLKPQSSESRGLSACGVDAPDTGAVTVPHRSIINGAEIRVKQERGPIAAGLTLEIPWRMLSYKLRT